MNQESRKTGKILRDSEIEPPTHNKDVDLAL